MAKPRLMQRTLLAVAAAAAALAPAACELGIRYSVGGTVTGLKGQGLVLEDNSGDALAISGDGAFVFSKGVQDGIAYSITIRTQPSNPVQTCTVQNGSGTVARADVADIVVSCSQAGQFAYVVNQLSNNISAYVIDSTNGFLTPVSGSPFRATGTAPVSLAVDPNGGFLYVVDNGSNDVEVYSIDSATGALTESGLAQPTGLGPVAAAIDPTGSYLYVANFASNTISAYSVSSGFLTEMSNSPFQVGVQPSALAVHPAGNFLYVTNAGDGDVEVLAIDHASGSLSAIFNAAFPTEADPMAIAIDGAGKFAYVANRSAASISEFSINSTTGALTAVPGSPLHTTAPPEALAIDTARVASETGTAGTAADRLYVANVTANNEVGTYSIAATTGALAPADPPVAAGLLPDSIALDPSGLFAYVANENSNDISVYAVNAATGALTPVRGSPFAAGNQPRAIAID